MKHKIFLLLVFIVYLLSGRNATAQDSTSHLEPDTSAFKWPSFIGGDLFLGGELLGVHFDAENAGTFGFMGFGAGGEVRVRPVFLGTMVGAIVREDGATYDCTSIYGGLLIDRYRLEIGGTHAQETEGLIDKYNSLFLGASGRFGGIVFIEPEIKIVFPIDGTFFISSGGSYPAAAVVTRYFHLRDMFFGIGLKAGVGFN
ncbi:MAG: hypothetical protein WAO19_03920 [Candidatus Kryptoniota bacterium]